MGSQLPSGERYGSPFIGHGMAMNGRGTTQSLGDLLLIRLMAEIPNNHLGCKNPINNGISYLSTGAGFQPSTVVVNHFTKWDDPPKKPHLWQMILHALGAVWHTCPPPHPPKKTNQPTEVISSCLPSTKDAKFIRAICCSDAKKSSKPRSNTDDTRSK